MSAIQADLIAAFRDALADCKRIYIHAARDCLDTQREVTDAQRREFIRRMVDLHKGLLIKVYVTVARADRRWSVGEQALATELIDHIWQKRLEGDQLKQTAQRMFHDARTLKWYSLVRPFDQLDRLRERVTDLESVVVRIGTLVARSDGCPTSDETNAVGQIQRELDVHLHRLSLESGGEEESEDRKGHSAVQIVHQESTAIKVKHRLTEEDPEEPDSEPSTDSLADALARLNNLIGLDQVKREIETLTNFLKFQRRRKEVGLPGQDLGLHLIFQGNPGTGKTTVARIVGQILAALGLLQKGHLIETDRTGLVAEYAGQTGPKANRKIDEALDGVLFIDEAYSLVSSRQDDAYGHEAVQALIKRMEDQRDRLVVILAGYPGPMQELLRSNPGMTSRFGTQLTFDDYQPIDLGQIFQKMCDANRYVLPAASRARLLIGFQWLYEHRDEHFGNGRLARNVFEKSIRRLGNRVAAAPHITRELLTELLPEDISMKNVPESTWKELGTGAWNFSALCSDCNQPIQLVAGQLGGTITCGQCQASTPADWAKPVKV